MAALNEGEPVQFPHPWCISWADGSGHLDWTDCRADTGRVGWKPSFVYTEVRIGTAAELGAGGFESLVEHQAKMANTLRRKLKQAGWKLLNETPLPVVCFSHEAVESEETTTADIVSQVNGRGRAWISEVMLPGSKPALRACITSYRTDEGDIETLVEELDLFLSRSS